MKNPGEVVIYIDTKGEPHNALVTAVHPLMPDHISLAYVDGGVKEIIGLDHISKKDQEMPLHCWKDYPTYEEAAERGYHQGFYEGINHPRPGDKIPGNEANENSALPKPSDEDESGVSANQQYNGAPVVNIPPETKEQQQQADEEGSQTQI